MKVFRVTHKLPKEGMHVVPQIPGVSQGEQRFWWSAPDDLPPKVLDTDTPPLYIGNKRAVGPAGS